MTVYLKYLLFVTQAITDHDMFATWLIGRSCNSRNFCNKIIITSYVNSSLPVIINAPQLSKLNVKAKDGMHVVVKKSDGMTDGRTDEQTDIQAAKKRFYLACDTKGNVASLLPNDLFKHFS